jgi:hypothetical protein
MLYRCFAGRTEEIKTRELLDCKRKAVSYWIVDAIYYGNNIPRGYAKYGSILQLCGNERDICGRLRIERDK